MERIGINFFGSVDLPPAVELPAVSTNAQVVDGSVDGVVARFEEWLIDSSFRPSTKRAYTSRFRQFERFIEIEKSKQQHLPDFSDMAKAFLQTASTESALKQGSINCFISLFETMAKISGLENVGLQRQVVESSEKMVMNRAQQKLYLIAASKSQSCRDKLLVLVFLRTNIRLGEATNIKLLDLIEEEGQLKIRIAGRTGQREEIMDSKVRQGIQEWLDERAKSDVFMESQYLFPGAGGYRITTSAMDAVLRKIGWKARLNVSARLLRNTYLSRLKDEQRLFLKTPNYTMVRYLPGSDSRSFLYNDQRSNA